MRCDTYLLGEDLHLLGLQTSVGEHADLASDVGPVVLAAELLQVLAKQRAHLNDAVSHALNLAKPLLVQLGVVHNGRGNAGAVDGGVRVEGADQDLDLGFNTLLLFGVLADERESTDTLTVETLRQMIMLANTLPSRTAHWCGVRPTHHVLGETLAQSNVVALLDEVARSESILVSVTTGEALVGHVEEGEVALLLHDIADLAPLVLGGVDTGRVVSACVQQDDAVVRGGLDIGDQALKVQTDCVLVVVAVLLDLEARVLEDGIVVGPARVGEVDLLRMGVEALQERTADAQGTSAGDGLGDDEAVLGQGGGLGAVGQLGSGLGEGRDAGDTGVLLVEARSDDLVLRLADGGQDVRLALVVT